MECIEFENLIMPYLSDKLDEKTKEDFELHYFSCDKCFVNLKIAENIYSGKVPVRVEVKRKSLIFKPIYAFNTLLLLIVLTLSFYYVIGNKTDKRFYEISNFSPPLYIKTELRGNNQDIIFERAMVFYNKKNYQSALKELNRIKITKNKNYKVIFFRAVCELLTDNLKLSEKDFSIIIGDMNPAYFDEAIYYKGIVLLRLGKPDESVSELKNLSTDKYSPLSNNAIELISRIETL